jgi:hypothetical protein
MRNEHFGNYTPRPPRCPSCSRIMRFVRAARFDDLNIQYVFECRACGVSHIDAAEIEQHKRRFQRSYRQARGKRLPAARTNQLAAIDGDEPSSSFLTSKSN